MSRSLSESSHRTHSQSVDREYLALWRRKGQHKELVCKNGPDCHNHNWDRRSPIVKVCTRDDKCPNHDWTRVDRVDSPYRMRCSNGAACNNHEWGRRSPMRNLVREPRRKIKVTKSASVSALPVPTKPAAPPQPVAPAKGGCSHEQCMMHQNERHFSQ